MVFPKKNPLVLYTLNLVAYLALPSPSAFFSSYLRQLFRNLFHKQGFTYDYVFDWNMLKFGGPRQDADPAAVAAAAAAANPNTAGAAVALPPGGGNGGDVKKHRHPRGGGNGNSNGGAGPSAAAAAAVSMPGTSGNGGGPKPMELGGVPMAPPEVPFGAAQPPVVR